MGLSQAGAASNNAPERIILPQVTVKNLQVNAGFGWGIFSGSIYNGNQYFVITQLTVTMTPIHDHHMEMMDMTSHEPKEYVIDLKLPPLSKGAISVAIDTDVAHVHDFEWGIIQAIGYRIKQ
jgi:hypothetical protein